MSVLSYCTVVKYNCCIEIKVYDAIIPDLTYQKKKKKIIPDLESYSGVKPFD